MKTSFDPSIPLRTGFGPFEIAQGLRQGGRKMPGRRILFLVAGLLMAVGLDRTSLNPVL
jgi:hypothetical protein